MAIQQFNYNALKGLKPLVSDLVTTSAPKNKFLGETYSADPTAIQSRLGEYEAYDPSKFSGLSDYLRSKSAAVNDGNLYFKKGDFQNTLNNLYGLDSGQLAALSSPLSGYTPVGEFGGQKYYTREDIGKALSGYGAVAKDKWDTYSDSIRSQFSPVTTLGNQVLIRPEEATSLGNVVGLSDYLSKINPLRTKTETWEPAIPTNSNGPGNTRLFRGTNNATPPENQGWIESPGTYDYESGVSSPSTWSRTVQDTPLTVESFWQQYGATPEGGWSDANTKRTDLSYILRRKSSTDPMQKWMSDTSFLPRFSLYGTGSPEDIQRGFNVLQRMSPQNIGEFWSLGKDVQKGMLENPAAALQFMRATANPANNDWLSVGAEGGFSGFDAYKWNPTTGLTVDPSRYMQIDDSGNGLFGSVFKFMDPILDKVDPLHNPAQNLITKGLGFDSQEQAFGTIMPMVVDYFLPGVGSGLSAANAASVGNWGGALTGALGAYTGMTGAGLNLTSNAALNQALTKAAITGVGTAAGGGKFSDVLRNATLSGAGSYGGSLLGGYTQGMSPLAKIAAQTGYGAGMGGLSSALRGKDFNYGATQGALSGLTNSTMRALLANQLYKG